MNFFSIVAIVAIICIIALKAGPIHSSGSGSDSDSDWGSDSEGGDGGDGGDRLKASAEIWEAHCFPYLSHNILKGEQGVPRGASHC